MSGIKGAKQKTILTDEECCRVYAMLKRDNTTVLTHSQLKELGMSSLTYCRRASLKKFNVRLGYEYSSFDSKIAGKAWIGFYCEICKKAAVMKAISLRARTYKEYATRAICGVCYIPLVTKTQEWQKKNSVSQKIAQNRPDVKERHRKNTIAMWNDPLSKIRCANSQPNSGSYNGLKFDSLNELAYILSIESRCGKIERFNKSGIQYFDSNGKKRIYIPDFIVDDQFIVEVKGRHRNFNVADVELKCQALEAYAKTIGLNSLFIWDSMIDASFHKEARKIYEQVGSQNIQKV